MDVLEALNGGHRLLITKSTPLHLEGEGLEALTSKDAEQRFPGIIFQSDGSLMLDRDEWPRVFMCSVTTKPLEDIPGNLHELHSFLFNDIDRRGDQQEISLYLRVMPVGSSIAERTIPRRVTTIKDFGFLRVARGRVGDGLIEGTESLVILPVVVAQPLNCTI